MDNPEPQKHEMRKRMIFMLICVGIIFGSIFISKAIQTHLNNKYMASQSQLVTVSTLKVGSSEWQPSVKAAGSVRAIRGVNVTTELAGMVSNIYFTPGSRVKEREVLIQLNASTDIALLHSLEANAELALVTYERDKKQFEVHAVSKQQLDTDIANLKSANAQVVQQMATVEKKTIKAPFAGRLGINLVNPGQYLNPGDTVVSLQMLDPIYVDFYVPQQMMAELKVGQEVKVTSDSFPGKILTGPITTIDPAVNAATRNVVVEATLKNPDLLLSPGMFTYVEVATGVPKKFLTLPLSAISFNPYGQIVYVITSKGKDKSKLVATQHFIKTGDSRGDQIQVLSGIKEGDTIVTSGQLKLKNGSEVTIDNSIVQPNSAAPVVPDEGY
jgi:membrane fusion protein (multidrug efflux system)